MTLARILAILVVLLPLGGAARSEIVSPLFARGYNVLPLPRKVELHPDDFALSGQWTISLGRTVSRDDVAVETLREEWLARFRFPLALGASTGQVIRLEVLPGSVPVGAALDRNRAALAEEAYRIELGPKRITVTANAQPGLLYGVFTLTQLVQPRNGQFLLPEGTITDWPDLGLRHIYWDDAHHLETVAEFKRIIRQAAFFKANGLTIKLEGHFQYRSAPALVEPHALSPSEFQQLTDYALRYHVQLVPYLDAPGHIAFILKHPEYAGIRAFPDSNYELCATNPDSYKLLTGMFQDLLDANKGGKYFYLSTDEPYYIGMAANPQCNESARARELGSVGKLLAEFVQKTAGYLHDRGRTVLFWGEHPLKVEDIPSLPSHLVNGEVYNPVFDRAFRAHGIRQMIYTSTEGEEKLFPNYFPFPASRITEIFEKISFDPARKNADVIGAVNAGWADMGLHPETFWLGYVAATAAAWHPGAPEPRELMSSFYRQFYGYNTESMDRVYQLASLQAQAWTSSWDRVDSKWRKPIWGNSDKIFQPARPAHDQTVPLPPTDLNAQSNWREANANRLKLAAESHEENDELLGLLYQNVQRSSRNRYNLRVMLSLAYLCRQNLDFLEALGRMDALLESARISIKKSDEKAAVASLDTVLDTAGQMLAGRNKVLHDAEEVWYEAWLPRVPEANGRRFLHELDDVKDHLPDRTIDMSYLVYRELNLPMGGWITEIQNARNHLAEKSGLPLRKDKMNWLETGTQ